MIVEGMDRAKSCGAGNFYLDLGDGRFEVFALNVDANVEAVAAFAVLRARMMMAEGALAVDEDGNVLAAEELCEMDEDGDPVLVEGVEMARNSQGVWEVV